MRKDFKAELANFKANNYLDKWIVCIDYRKVRKRG